MLQVISTIHIALFAGEQNSHITLCCYLLSHSFFETETIMTIWLKTYPPEAPLFLRLSMIGSLFDMLGNSTTNAAWATGNIKRYYLYVASIRCLVFPLSWIAFTLGCPAFTSYIIIAIIYLIVVFVKPWILNGLMNFPKMMFLREVIFKVIVVTAVSAILPYLFYAFMPDTLIWHLILICVSGLSACASVYLLGLTSSERHTINETILDKLSKLAKNVKFVFGRQHYF